MTRSTIKTCAAGLAVGCLVLIGCGGDDDAGAAPTAAPETGDTVSTANDVDGPDATVDPNLPEAYVGVIGPVEVDGEPLPELPRDGSADPATGMAAPVLIGQDYDGSTVRVDGAADGPTMVVFLAHWCSHCNAEVPRINELRDDGRFPDELNIVAVSTQVTNQQPNFPPDEWLDSMDWTYPAIADGVDMERKTFIASAAYGVNGFPFVTLIDGDGVVVDRWSGERDPDDIIEAIGTGLGI